MKSKLLSDNGLKVYALVLETGDELVQALTQFAQDNAIHGASLTAIGALERCTIGWLDWEQKKYIPIPVNEQCEVASLIGDIGQKDGAPAFHVHMVVGTKGGAAHAGHMLEAWVRPTLEVIVTETPSFLIRSYNRGAHMPLIDLDKN